MVSLSVEFLERCSGSTSIEDVSEPRTVVKHRVIMGRVRVERVDEVEATMVFLLHHQTLDSSDRHDTPSNKHFLNESVDQNACLSPNKDKLVLR